MKSMTTPRPPRTQPSWRHFSLLASMVLVLFTTFVTTAPASAATPTHNSDTTTYTGKPNTAPTTSSSATNTHPVPPNPHPFTGVNLPANANTSVAHPFVASMQPIDIPLQAGVGTVVTSSDQQITVSVPTTAIAATDAATLLGPAAPAGATPHLIVTQVAPGSGSTSGGVITLGTYLFQLQDGNGHELATGKGLAQPITLTYHWPDAHPALPLDHFFVAVNGTHPVTMAAAHLGVPARQPVTVQAPTTTAGATAATGTTTTTPALAANILLTASSTTGAFTSNAPEGYFGTPATFQNDLHTGDLTTNMPISVPSGPGGLTPQVNLGYSSGAVSATHSVQAAAPWVGDGWNLNMGEITWSETFDGAMPTGYQWQNNWSLVDASGSSSTLVPPSTDVATFFDDTGHVYYNVNTHTYPHPVVQWHTAPESHAKIISYVGTNNVNGMPANAPCWRVWLPNGDMEEFGCTPDAIQWYPAGADGRTSYVAAWKLDLITDPNGNQIQITYDRDTTTTSPQNVTYPRDEVMNTISWDSPTCHDPNNRCTGAAWAPLYNVNFSHSNAVATVYPGARSCGAQGNGLRCDDPVNEPAGNFGTPLLTQTQVLNAITVRVYANSTWNILRTYQLAYDQGALSPNAIDDPGTGTLMSAAGFLLLDQIKETGTDGTGSTTFYPPQVFKYEIGAGDAQFYEDSNYHPANQSVDCGPTWNTGKKTPSDPLNCLLWSRSYNGFYMTEADNGQGLQQTFAWTNMHTNEHDPSGPDWTDPTVCNSQQAQGINTPYPCDMPDDNGWSHIALTGKTVTETSPTSANATRQTTGTWNYYYHLAILSSNECIDCGVGMYWGNTNSKDYQDYYNGQFRGFALVQQVNPDGGTTFASFYTTEGWGVYDNTQVVACYNGHGGTGGCAGENSPDSALINAASGQEYEEDVIGPMSGGDGPLLSVKKTTWQAICPTSTIGASPSVSFTAPNSLHNGTVTMNLNWDGNLVSEQDPYNPVMVCDIQPSKVDTYSPNGTITYSNRGSITTNNVPYSDVATSYDTSNWYGHVTATTTTGNDLTSTPTRTENVGYIWNDAISTTNTSATGTYIVDHAAFDEVHDPSGNTVQCTYHDYDGAPNYRGSQSSLTKGLETATERYTVCTPFQIANWTATDTSYNSNGNPVNTTDADALQGVAGHKATTGTCTGFTGCLSYDSLYGVLPTTSTDVLNQATTTAYTSTAAFGYGLWPSSATDANGQTASTTYDVLGRALTTTAPGETAAFTTSVSYTNFCPATGANAPCLEVDTTRQLGGGATTVTRDFYDGMGQLVETRSPAPSGQDVVQYVLHDLTHDTTFQSHPYFVTAYTGAPGAAAYSTPDASQLGTTTVSDTLGRTLTATDATSAVTTTSYGMVCAPAGTNNDQACYTSTTVLDANHHKSVGYTDALGRSIYAQDFTGNSSYTLYRTTKTQYDVVGNTTSATYADGTHQATATYDGLGRETGATDPDLGAWTYGYDYNGNPTTSVDPRGSVGTVDVGYDGLNRPLWKANTSNGSNPYATYTYDSTASGNQGVGRLTSETFASGPSQSVTGGYRYTYDNRGRQTGWTMTLGATSYPYTTGYNDANQATTLTYPDGDLVTTSYGAQDWLSGITETLSGSTKTFLNSISYTGANGAAGEPTTATVGNSAYQWSFTYDTDLRPTDTNVKLLSTNSTLYDEQLGYDAIGNVTTTKATLPAGTDNQAFCYDEQDRLTWSGSTGTPTCSTAITTGTLPTYQQSYSYDTLDRLTQGPAGSGYTYGDSAHLNAVTSANGYTAAYDTAGNMTCRAKSGSGQSCTPTAQHGQLLTYDALGQMLTWQSSSSSSPSTESDAYDGEGHRVQRVTTPGGSTTPTTTTFVGSSEEVSVTSGTTTTIKYYAAGPVQVESINGSFSYLVQDHLGSIAIEMGSSGNLRGQQLFTPYGTQRYSLGSFNANHGFTDQYTDTNNGLEYYGARYYDPVVGQFVSADTVQGPNRYGYVSGNPETFTDPSGHQDCGFLGLGCVASAVGDFFNVPTIGQSLGSSWSDLLHGDWGNAWGNLWTASEYISTDILIFDIVHDDGNEGGCLDDCPTDPPAPKVVHTEGNEGNGAIVPHATEPGSPPNLPVSPDWHPNNDGNGEGNHPSNDGNDEGNNPVSQSVSGCANSFAANTLVATPQGEQAIGTLHIGDQVLAYDSSTGKAQSEPVQHVFVNHDNNLLDVTLQSDINSKPVMTGKITQSSQGINLASDSPAFSKIDTETLHTTTEHPFLTVDRGWVDAHDLKPGEHVYKLDGTFGVVVAITMVSGQAVRYNLTVKDKHTYAVGDEQWIVHNCGATLQPDPRNPGEYITTANPKNLVTTDINGQPLTNNQGLYDGPAYSGNASKYGGIPPIRPQKSINFPSFIEQYIPGYTYNSSDWTYIVGQYKTPGQNSKIINTHFWEGQWQGRLLQFHHH